MSKTESSEGLPKGWRRVRLLDAVSHRAGNSTLIKGSLAKAPLEGLFPAFSASGQDVWHAPPEHSGDAVVVASVGSIGNCFVATGRWTAIANTHIIWPDPSVLDNRYLFRILNKEGFWIWSQTTQKFIRPKETLQQIVPIPSLAEQQKIVEAVEGADAIRRLHNEASEKAGELLDSLVAQLIPTALRLGTEARD